MSNVRSGALALAGLLIASCLEDAGASREVGLAREALSVCDETVPATRYIDGIPAYAQCAASENSAIFSNNGIDTSTTQQGSDWVRTQWSGGYQCTELAHRYLLFKWNVKWLPNGNAGAWCDTQPTASSGVVQTTTPVHGDLMVLAPGSCGAAASTGHVNVVDVVDNATGRLIAVEQNRAGRNMYMQSCAKCFLHVVANDGTRPEGSAGAAAPTSPAAGASAPPTTPTAPTAPGAAGARAPRPSGRAGQGAAPVPPTTTPAAAGSAAPTPVVPPQTAAAGTPAVVSTQTSPVGASGLAGAPAPVAQVPRPASNAVEPAGCSVAAAGHGRSGAWYAWLPGVALVLAMRRRRGRAS